MKTNVRMPLLLSALLLALGGARSPAAIAEDGPAPGGPGKAAPPKPAAVSTEERLAALEKRIQSLERAMVEKDARIAELKEKLKPPARLQPVPGQGFTFRFGPDQMKRFQEHMNEFLGRNLDELFNEDRRGGRRDPFADDDFFRFGGRWGRPGLPRARPARKPRLGVALQDASAELRARYRNDVKEGAFVTEVVPLSAADQAGLVAGDCVTAFGEQPVHGAADLIDAIRNAPAGAHTLAVTRRGEPIRIKVNLGKAQAREEAAPGWRREGGWLRRDGKAPGAQRREITEVRSSALELNAELAKAMKLDEKQRAKMEAVLAAQAKKLSAEYARRTEERRWQPGLDRSRALRKLAQQYVQAAEKELEGVLSPEQFKTWRAYRARHSGISISRQLQIEGRSNDGERLGF